MITTEIVKSTSRKEEIQTLLPKESIQRMAAYVPPMEGRMGNLRLDFNENLWGASPAVIEAIGKITQEECGCYPEYEVFKRMLSIFFGVEETCIIPTNGSDEAIRVLFDTYVDKGEEVILLSPSYSMYELFSQVAGAKIVWISYPSDFSFPVEEVLTKIGPNTRLIALATPNNPTGTLIPRKDLQRIIEKNPKMLVLIDEAYGPFAKISNIDLVNQYQNVFVTQTFSKAYGLAGLRIGTLFSCCDNIEVISRVLAPSYSVDAIAMLAATAAMGDRAHRETYVEEVLLARDEFVAGLSKLGFQVVPSEANFVFVFFGQWKEKLVKALARKKILVRERAEEWLKGYLRITIGTREQMRIVLSCIKELFSATALIFDMDGVLIDESRSYRACIAKTAEFFLKGPIDFALVQSLKAKGGYNNDYDCTQALLAEYGLQVKREEIIDRFDAYYQDLKFLEQWLLDEQVLLKLKQKFRLGIFTGRPAKDAFDALRRFGKESMFEVVVTDDDVSKRKPDPEGLFLVCKRLGVEKAIYFGDSIDDAKTAWAALMEFIGVVPPKGSADALAQIGVQTILENFNMIEEILCQKEW